MDLAFFRRSQKKFASPAAAQLDYRVLVAMLEAIQSSTASARVARALSGEGGAAPHRSSLVELILGGPAWREAIAAQRGSFRPDWARRFGSCD